MIYDKKVSGKRTLTYDDIVEEAISFGWIDNLTRSLNDQQAMYYLSPRKPKSPWSKLNKDRVEKLIKEKLITKAGFDAIERSKKDGSWDIYDAVEKLEVPEDLKNEQKEIYLQRGFRSIFPNFLISTLVFHSESQLFTRTLTIHSELFRFTLSTLFFLQAR
jgi:uncharacterized protein YdeI (YjbR/CyaY-like superfamily)